MEKAAFALPRAGYEPPRVEIVPVAVERGFAQSGDADHDGYDDNYGTETPGRDDLDDNWYFK